MARWGPCSCCAAARSRATSCNHHAPAACRACRLGSRTRGRPASCMASHSQRLPARPGLRVQGIRVGEWWKDRLDCRQWGAHFPHVAGIAGQSNVGAQSVVLSGG